MQLETEEYMTIERVNAVRERAGKLRRQFLKYKDAESVYSLTHRKLLEMADEAGAICRIDGTVLITCRESSMKSPERRSNDRKYLDVFSSFEYGGSGIWNA